MEVIVAPQANPMDFDFTSSVYATAPMTPKFMAAAGDYYFSAPPSPTRISEIPHLDDDHDHDDFDNEFEDNARGGKFLPITVPFAWEIKPGVPKSYDFAFDVSGELTSDSIAAEDLFQHGLIKKETKTAMEERERGRERGSSSSGNLSSSRSRRTRSLPPVIRVLDQTPAAVNTIPPSSSSGSTCTALSASGSGKGSKKWSFKDLFLFRSASDGRAMDRDPLKKYSAIFRKHDEDLRNSSMRSDRNGSGSVSKRRGRVSAHELHYTVNRAVSNDMKKKTFLPYKQGILGRLAFNPTKEVRKGLTKAMAEPSRERWMHPQNRIPENAWLPDRAEYRIRAEYRMEPNTRYLWLPGNEIVPMLPSNQPRRRGRPRRNQSGADDERNPPSPPSNQPDPNMTAAIQQAVAGMIPNIVAQTVEALRQSQVTPPIHTPVTETHPNADVGDIDVWLERFNKQKPRVFSSAINPIDAENWIRHLEKIFKVLGCPDQYQVSLASYKLEDDAHNWWESWVQCNPEAGTPSWEQFKSLFYQQYFTTADKDAYIREYAAISQGEDESIVDYQFRFLRLARFAGATVGTANNQVDKFKWSLNNKYKHRLLNHKYSSVSEVVDAAKDIDRARQGGYPLKSDSTKKRTREVKSSNTDFKSSSYSGSRKSSNFRSPTSSQGASNKESYATFPQKCKDCGIPHRAGPISTSPVFAIARAPTWVDMPVLVSVVEDEDPARLATFRSIGRDRSVCAESPGESVWVSDVFDRLFVGARMSDGFIISTGMNFGHSMRTLQADS
ncbi:hypothetical protein OSB04_003391 [Centaurea solstitialis]|uniref:Retrotransposon gag domain-containing protein n=1 Tax=Centaurea solstitialis TaxID=347529 RepID=A0AA38WTQ6_9ASTR|nr:hypothetical protein OSB04_003391 [Centaurea solstitialis]